MVFQKTMRIGYEIEGGFDKNLRQSNSFSREFFSLLKQLGFKSGGDGSIHTNYYNLELKSVVYKIKTKDDLKKVFEDFKKISAYIKEVNRSCGIHIHISFDNLSDYYQLLSFDFADEFIKKYEKKFKTTEELKRITNGFCIKYEDEKHFKSVTKKSLNCMNKGFRYYAVNYNAFNLYKTIEFRLFCSTKKPKKFRDYMTFLYDYVFNYLKENDDGLKKKDLIKKQRKMTEEDEDKKIIISYSEIEDDAFNNYVNKQEEIKRERENNEASFTRQRRNAEEQRRLRENERRRVTELLGDNDDEHDEGHFDIDDEDEQNNCNCEVYQREREQERNNPQTAFDEYINNMESNN